MAEDTELLEGQEAEQPERTLREDLEAARDEVVGRQEAQTQDVQAGRRDGSGGADRARGGDGRYRRKEEQSATPAPVAPGAPTARAQPAAAAPAPAPAPVALAPQGWSQEAKALWPTLNEKVQAEISKREADIHRFATTVDHERSLGREFAQVAQNYQDVIQASGVHPLRYLDDTLRVMRVLTGGTWEQKVEMLKGVAQRQGIDFRALAPGAVQPNAGPAQPGAPPQPPPQQYPPELLEMARWMGNFRREQEQFQQRQAEEARRAQAAMAQQVMTEIEAFRAKPESEFFDHVRDQMTVLLANGLADTLEQAYDQAIYMRPDIRQALEQRAADKTRKEAEQRARVLQARRRSGSVRGGAGGQTVPRQANSQSTVRQDIEAAIAEVTSRI